MHEVIAGPQSAEQTLRMQETGQLVFDTVLFIDAMSLHAAVAAVNIKAPAEKNLAVHVFWLRGLLDLRRIGTLRWVDTRDMHSDCHTKG